MKKIAICGTHGAAKTSLVYKLAAYYKMNDKNVTVIHETARHCPFPINKSAVFKTTLYLVSSQLKAELDAEAEGFELAICDRSLSDHFIYINYLKKDNAYTYDLENFSLRWIKNYDVLIYLEPTQDAPITNDGIRAVDAEYQMDIRDSFRDFIDKLERVYGSEINIVKAESDQIFQEEQCLELMDLVDKTVYNQPQEVQLV